MEEPMHFTQAWDVHTCTRECTCRVVALHGATRGQARAVFPFLLLTPCGALLQATWLSPRTTC